MSVFGILLREEIPGCPLKFSLDGLERFPLKNADDKNNSNFKIGNMFAVNVSLRPLLVWKTM